MEKQFIGDPSVMDEIGVEEVFDDSIIEEVFDDSRIEKRIFQLFRDKETYITADYKGQVYQVFRVSPSGSVGIIYKPESEELDWVTPDFINITIVVTSEQNIAPTNQSF